MDSAMSAGGRGPFRGQDAPCARLNYCIRIRECASNPFYLEHNLYEQLGL